MKTLKIFSFLFLVIIVTVIIGRPILAYWIGYYEWSFKPLFVSFLLDIIKDVSFLALLTIWITALVTKKQKLVSALFLLFSVILFGLNAVFPTDGAMIVLGLKNRLIDDCSLDNLREFAQEFNCTPSTENQNHLGVKSFNQEDLAKTSFKNKYPFLAWVDSGFGKGPSGVSEYNQNVHVRWGGALVGHWGFSIGVNGAKVDLPSELGSTVIRLSDDIVVIYELD